MQLETLAIAMPASASESYLLHYAERAFLKPWALPGPAYKAGKEISDLVIPFGDDVVIVSDKACDFEIERGLDLAWSRWAQAATTESVKQLSGALRRLEMPTTRVFVDPSAHEPLAFPLAPLDRRRYHLVGVARPNKDPTVQPPGWSGLRYDDVAAGAPFTLGPLFVRGQFVHLFDGETMDLLLDRLDTAPDFIAYLTARAAALAGGSRYRFKEPDLLAHATLNWMQGLGYRIDGPGPVLSPEIEGLWASFAGSSPDLATAEKNKPSRFIDATIEDFHREYLDAQATPTAHPDAPNHENAMRILAQESRFARRMIASTLVDLLGESNQRTAWAATIPSPSNPDVRYMLMTFPPPPARSAGDHDQWCLQELSNQIIVAADEFGGETIVGLGINNRAWDDSIRIIRVFDARDLTDQDRRHAASLRARGVFAGLEATDVVHRP